ncbi:MAG: sugar transferase [Calditrichia bacterium]
MIQYLRRFSIIYFWVDFVFLTYGFFSIQLLKRDTLALTTPYLKLLMAFYGIWLVVSLFTRKFQLQNYRDFRDGLMLLAKSSLFLIYGISFLIVIMKLSVFSRVHVFGTCLLLFILESSLFALYYHFGGKKIIQSLQKGKSHTLRYHRFSILRMSTDLLLFMAAFLLIYYFRHQSLRVEADYGKVLLVLSGLWFVTGFLTRKFNRRRYPNFFYEIAPYLKSVLLLAAGMSVLIFAFHLFEFSRIQIYGTLLLFFVLELIFRFSYFLLKKEKAQTLDITSAAEVRKLLKQESLQVDQGNGNGHLHPVTEPAHEILQHRYLKKLPQVFEFISQSLPLSAVDRSELVVLDTHNPYNIETIEDGSLNLLVNLHRVNDFRYLNRYFLEAHRKFYNGGWFVGRADTISTFNEMFYKKYPKLLADLLFPFYFIYVRILPKLPGIKKLYFMLTRGKNRVISRAELLGRLHFCGFEVTAEKQIGYDFYFIARKMKTPCFDENPSYSPVIRLRRVGLNRNPVIIYKLRTMHPYSEYLQDYVYRRYNLEEGGKFKNDFRLTQWGRIFRKLWIDELPQFVNYLQGDISLVGVRALSEHYFKLYPKDVQVLRTKFKPGLVPPYYADMPKTFEEIVESERRYLLNKLEHPISTDFRYFSKALFNIFFRSARSQ